MSRAEFSLTEPIPLQAETIQVYKCNILTLKEKKKDIFLLPEDLQAVTIQVYKCNILTLKEKKKDIFLLPEDLPTVFLCIIFIK